MALEGLVVESEGVANTLPQLKNINRTLSGCLKMMDFLIAKDKNESKNS